MSSMTIGERLRKLRNSKGWTQQYVADELDIDRSNYSKYELNKLSLSAELLVKLSQLFDESIDFILTGKDKYK